MPKALTHRQTIFARLILETPTATAAAIGAGYAASSARFQASRLLAVPAVRRRIEELRQHRQDLREAPGILVARTFDGRIRSALARGKVTEARKFIELWSVRAGLI